MSQARVGGLEFRGWLHLSGLRLWMSGSGFEFRVLRCTFGLGFRLPDFGFQFSDIETHLFGIRFQNSGIEMDLSGSGLRVCKCTFPARFRCWRSASFLAVFSVICTRFVLAAFRVSVECLVPHSGLQGYLTDKKRPAPSNNRKIPGIVLL